MRFHSPLESQGHYRYDPTALEQQGPARLFPHAGEDGLLRYVVTQLRRNLVAQGRLSEPLSLLLRQLERTTQTLDQAWSQVSTLLVDFKWLQSGWFNVTLPPNEQFDAAFVRERRTMTTTLLAAKTAAKIHADSVGRRSQFYQVLETVGRVRPVVSQIHERDGGLSDREFARQRLAGQNPMVVRQARSSDQALLQVWAEAVQAQGHSIDLVEAAAAKRLFVADYPLLQNLTPADLQPGRYVGSPIAIFYRAETGLEPVLIQVEQGRLLTPGADADRWMQAKLCVQTADVTCHELVTHLCDTHLAMEAFAIATPRQLPATHPVYRLLRPHFRFLLAINTRGNEILLGEGAAIDQLLAPTLAASVAIINRAYRERSFQDYALPTVIKQRGIEPDVLSEFPYRDDALLLWEAIERYVTRYLQRYYPDDQAVQHDPYLQAWAAELGAPLDSRPLTEFPQAPAWLPSEWVSQVKLNPDSLPTYPRVPGFPPVAGSEPGSSGALQSETLRSNALSSLQQLIDIITQVIFTCGPQHAAVNFSQFDYVGYTPNAPLALYSHPDMAGSVQQLLPGADQDLGQMELTFALSGIRWGTLGSTALSQFVDRGDRQSLEQFQADLANIEVKINARNQQRLMTSGIEYPYLLPSRIPNSINI